MTAPQFIDRDPIAIQKETKAALEEALGKPIQPAQAEALLIDAWAYRELLLRSSIQSVGEQNMVAFASGVILDRLGELVGVQRIAPLPATCTLRFSDLGIIVGQTIPIGYRVSNAAGTIIFEVTQEHTVTGDDDVIDLPAECQTDGIDGNGFAIGEINTPLDAIGDAISGFTIGNLAVTAGGSEEETDDQLRQRIYLAPNSFSVAGPTGAYVYWAFTASPLIADVKVKGPLFPGTVGVYPLYIDPVSGEPITTPDVILMAVDAILNDLKIRPLCDSVVVASPTISNHALTVSYVRYQDYDEPTTTAAVFDAIVNLRNQLFKKLGRSFVVNELKKVVMSVPGVYDVTVSPDSNITAGETEVLFLNSISVSCSGYN